MTRTDTSETSGEHRAVTAALFLCLFAGQAALIAMSPVLADAASDLDVATATAGQLRTITGLAAGITALGLGAVAVRVSLGRQLLAASARAGSLTSGMPKGPRTTAPLAWDTSPPSSRN